MIGVFKTLSQFYSKAETSASKSQHSMSVSLGRSHMNNLDALIFAIEEGLKHKHHRFIVVTDSKNPTKEMIFDNTSSFENINTLFRQFSSQTNAAEPRFTQIAQANPDVARITEIDSQTNTTEHGITEISSQTNAAGNSESPKYRFNLKQGDESICSYETNSLDEAHNVVNRIQTVFASYQTNYFHTAADTIYTQEMLQTQRTQAQIKESEKNPFEALNKANATKTAEKHHHVAETRPTQNTRHIQANEVQPVGRVTAGAKQIK